MAQRRSSSRTRSSGRAASPGSDEAAASTDPGEGDEGSAGSGGEEPDPSGSKPIEVRAGGFVTYVDPATVAASPDPIIPCSICGAHLVDDRCPNGHGQNKSGGWQAAEREHEDG